MRKFKWGHSFPELNQDLLERYSSCRDSGDVVKVQQDYLAEIKQQDKDERLRHEGMKLFAFLFECCLTSQSTIIVMSSSDNRAKLHRSTLRNI